MPGLQVTVEVVPGDKGLQRDRDWFVEAADFCGTEHLTGLWV